MVQICELTNNSGLIEEISFTGKHLVAFSCNQTVPQLDVWKRNDNGTFSFIRQEQFAIFRGMWRSVEMDDRYAAIAISRDNVKTELYFVSMKTMKIEHSFMFNGSYRYDSNLVFVADGNVLWCFDFKFLNE